MGQVSTALYIMCWIDNIKCQEFATHLNMGSSLKEDSDHLLVASGACVYQGRVARAALGVDIGPVGDEEPHDVRVPGRGGLHQGRAVALHAAILNVSAHCEQNLEENTV